MSSPLAAIRRAGVVPAATALGYRVRGRRIAPCPSCGNEGHGRAVSVLTDEAGDELWHCHYCQRTGDAVSFIAAAEKLEGRWPEIIDRARSLLHMGDDYVPPPRREAPPRAPMLRPVSEIHGLWDSAVRVSDSPAVAAWQSGADGMKPRPGIRLDHVELFDLARVVSQREMPSWARFGGRPWTVTGHLLILPAYDASGAFVSLRARRVVPENGTPKALPPALGGGSASGLVLAEGIARGLLRGSAEAQEMARRNSVVVTEGEPRFLAWASRYSDADESAPAVFGIWSGGWSEEFARAIPDGATVVIDTDRDEPGDKYAAQIEASFVDRMVTGRVRVGRWRGMGDGAKEERSG